MVGLKSFCAAGVTISGIDLAEKIRKRQFKIGKLGGSKATMPEIWRTALAASLAIITNSQSEPHRPSVEARIAPEPAEAHRRESRHQRISLACDRDAGVRESVEGENEAVYTFPLPQNAA